MDHISIQKETQNNEIQVYISFHRSEASDN